MHGHCGQHESKTEECKRNGITDEVSQQCAANAEVSAVISLDAQAGGPLAQSETCQTREYSQIEQRERNRQKDSRGFGRTACGTSTAAEHPRYQSTGDDERDECDVVD